MKATCPKGPQKNVKNGIRETEIEGGRGRQVAYVHRKCIEHVGKNKKGACGKGDEEKKIRMKLKVESP